MAKVNMKTYHIVAIIMFLASPAIADEQMERYNPNQSASVPAPAMSNQQQPQMQQQPRIQQQQPIQQIQPQVQKRPAKNGFKKFDINDDKPVKAIKHKKETQKAKKQAVLSKSEQKAAPVKAVIEQVDNEPPKYIDIQAILERGKIAQIEAKKEKKIADQIEKSTQTPNAASMDQAKTVFTYIPGSIYAVTTKVYTQTDVMLQAGEKLISVSGGDTSRWIVEEAVSGGNGLPEIYHVTIKPRQENLDSNILIFTDKRSYQLKVKSTDNSFNPYVSWEYPADEKQNMLFIKKQKDVEKAEVSNDEPISPEAFYFDYKISSNKGMFSSEYSWTPIKAFNDGSKTYLQVNPQMKNNEAPVLFVKDRDGKLNLVNYRHKNNYYIIDRLFEEAEMRNGTDEVVTISKENK